METRQSAVSRLDENVIITMLVAAVLATLILAFRFKNRQTCMPFDIRTIASHYHTGEAIRFETNAKDFKRLQWNFGDNETNETPEASAVHAYDQPGNYTVEVSVDRNCTEFKTLVITAAPKVVNLSMMPTIIAPQSAEVGKPAVFKDTTRGATQWEWRFGETATVDAVAAAPTYVYSTPGLKTVQLMVNNDPQRVILVKVFVNPAIIKPSNAAKNGGGGGGGNIVFIPEKPQNDPLGQDNPKVEPSPVAPDITKEQIEAELRLVADKQRTVESFLPYLCGNPNVQISLNGQPTSFTNFCSKLAELKNSKRIKELNVQMIKNEQTRCIIGMMVNYKKKSDLLHNW